MTVPAVPVPTAPDRSRRSEMGAALFALASAALAAGLAFADYLPVRVTVLLAAAMGAVFIARGLATRTLVPRTPADWANALVAVMLPVGLLVSADRSASWNVVCKVLGGLAIFYGIAGLARTRTLAAVPWLFLVGTLAFTVFVSLATAWPSSKIPFVPTSLFQALPRATLIGAEGEGFNPNIAGGAVALLLPPAVALALWGRGWLLRLLALVTAGVLGLVLLFTQSRGAWLAVACALALMPGVRYRRWWLVLLAGAIAAVAAVLLAGPDRLLSLVFPALGATEVSVSTLSGRMELWSRAIYLVEDFSFTGAGPGLFQKVVTVLYPLFLAGPDAEIPHAHNTFLQAAADFGIPGLIGHAALFLALLSALVAGLRRRREGALAALATGLLAAMAVYLLHGMIDATLYASQRTYILAAAVFGVVAALSEHLLTTTEEGRPFP